jgi:hypothetical protein
MKKTLNGLEDNRAATTEPLQLEVRSDSTAGHRPAPTKEATQRSEAGAGATVKPQGTGELSENPCY